MLTTCAFTRMTHILRWANTSTFGKVRKSSSRVGRYFVVEASGVKETAMNDNLYIKSKITPGAGHPFLSEVK